VAVGAARLGVGRMLPRKVRPARLVADLVQGARKAVAEEQRYQDQESKYPPGLSVGKHGAGLWSYA
jgi:hypothetical protein